MGAIDTSLNYRGGPEADFFGLASYFRYNCNTVLYEYKLEARVALSVRLDPALEAKVRQEAKRLGITKSAFIIDAIERALGAKNPAVLLKQVRSYCVYHDLPYEMRHEYFDRVVGTYFAKVLS